jgi:hypothetical protein
MCGCMVGPDIMLMASGENSWGGAWLGGAGKTMGPWCHFEKGAGYRFVGISVISICL